VISFTFRPLYSRGKSPWCPLNRRLDGPQDRSGRYGAQSLGVQLLDEELFVLYLRDENAGETHIYIIFPSFVVYWYSDLKFSV
jgi:hypothetical protein